MPCADIFPQSGNEDRDGIVAAPFQGAEYAHQPRLRLRAALAVGALYHLAPDHRRPELPLPVVVGRGDLRMTLKYETTAGTGNHLVCRRQDNARIGGAEYLR